MPEEKKKRARTVRNFPASTFSEALEFAKKVYKVGAGQKIRRLTLLEELGKSPTSSGARMAITNSNKYGLTTGSYNAEWIELTDLGKRATSDGISPREQMRARIDSAILSVAPFKSVYENLIEAKLPAPSVLIDQITEHDVSRDAAQEAIDTLIVNLRDVGLLKTIAGAERIISVDMRLDELSRTGSVEMSSASKESVAVFSMTHPLITSDRADYETTAFYVSPIGEEASDTRRHADLFASSIVEPAL